LVSAYLPEEKGRPERQRTEQAIRLAMEGRWEEAAAVNRAILELFPNDVDSYNRLGKALTELGRYQEAREAYQKALELDPGNAIAKRNLARLASLRETAAPVETRRAVTPQMFIEETGKTGIAVLQRPSHEALAKLSAGDPVVLRPRENALVVESLEGDYLGEVEPKLGQRLIKLMEGGNRYAAAITSVSEGDGRIIIREIYQHPSQAGKLSFPPAGGEPVKPYIKESLVRYEEEEEEPYEEWEGEEEGSSPEYLRLVEEGEEE